MAKAIAKQLMYRYIDSGAMYRAVTLFIQTHDVSIDQFQEMTSDQVEAMMKHIQITFQLNPETKLSEVYLNGVNVENKIRDLRISDWVSPVSAIPAIRHKLVALQKSYGISKGIVMDGRDICTRVFPNAELKFFMTARKEVRAKRRFDELNQKGFMVTIDEVIKNIDERDYTDTHRSESPLRKAEDAIILDNSDLTEQEQLEFAMNLVRNVLKVQC